MGNCGMNYSNRNPTHRRFVHAFDHCGSTTGHLQKHENSITPRRIGTPSFISVHVSPELLLPPGRFLPLNILGRAPRVRTLDMRTQLYMR